MERKLYTLVIAILIFYSQAYAQKVNGKVHALLIDPKSQPVEFATVSIVGANDSLVVKSSMSGSKGDVDVDGLKAGAYRVMISQVGLKTHVQSFTITAAKQTVDLGIIAMETETHNLKQVDVTAQKTPVKVKGDTVEFNAGSYKTQPNDNVEQLIKKLPGMEVDKDGKITAQGETVKKVLVDGKEFFGGDPKAATKNLPADAIDKVQLVNDKTDQTKNTGIDDGQREKVLNLKLKDDKKHGWFGNISGAGGNADRYLGQFNVNHFDNKKQFSALFLSNNVNESGFSMEDLTNFSGGDVFSAFGSSNGSITMNVSSNGRVNINNTFSGVNGGLIRNTSGGLNYSDVWGKKEQFKFGASLISVLSSNDLTQIDNVQDPAQSLLTNRNINGNNKYNSLRFNMNMEYKMDSLTTFKLKPVISANYQDNNNFTAFNTSDYNNVTKNKGNQALDQSIHTPAFGGQFSVNRKFANGKGSVNLFTTGNYTPYRNYAYNKSLISLYPGNAAPTDSLSNIYTAQDDNSSFSNSTLSYIKQLSKRKKLNLTISQNFNYKNDNANQATLNYNAVTGLYDIAAPQYSGIYDNTQWRYSTTVGINKSSDKTTLNFNAEVADLGLSGDFEGMTASSVNRNSWAFTPNASFSYRPKNGRNVFLSVRSDVSMPAINDLQPILNTTNTTYKKIGNPDLEMSRSLSVNANISQFDFKTNNYFNIYASYTQNWSGFSTESFYDNSGITTSRPINTDGNFATNLGINVGQPSKIKGLRFNYGLNGNVNRTINYINNNKNAVLRVSPGLSLGGSYDIDVVQLGLRTYTAYNNAKNSFQHAADQHYYNFNNTFNASVRPVKTWRLYSDLTQSLYRGSPSSANTSVYLLNAGIERYFLKGQNLTLALAGYDLLNQNSGIQRSIATTGQITNSQTNTIGQYFYLKLTYKITKLGASKNGPNGNGIVIMR